jgi:ribosomal protein S12 methylthiotransferase
MSDSASTQVVCVLSLGCAKNRVDSEVVLGRLRAAGYRVTDDPEEATLLVVNTCGFIEAAREESVDTVLQAGRWKSERPGRTVLVAGCLVQRYGEELADSLPEADKLLGTSRLHEVVELLQQPGRLRADAGAGSYLYDHRDRREPSLAGHSAYVKIAEGCDRPCAFCAVPAIRGPQQSRAPASVQAEVQDLVSRGVVEVNLVAQDLTAYGRDLGPGSLATGSAPPSLASLVQALGQVEGLGWLRLLYAYPSEVDHALLGVLGRAPVVPYLDVPLQHVDDGVLRRMRRGYTGDTARRLLDRLREAVPGLALRTSLLVGHPGETPAAFGRLERFVQEAGLDHVGVFAYSPEEGTAAAALPDPVPPEVAAERAAALLEHQRSVSAQLLARLVGTTLVVLLEGVSPESDWLRVGRHAGQAPEVDGQVILADVPPSVPQGTFIRAMIEQAGDHDLVGRFVGVV